MRESPLVCLSGGTRGLGLAMVRGLVEHGAIVATCGRNAEAIDQLRAEVGPAHLVRVVDVGNDSDVEKFAVAVQQDLGTPDILVNNAGIINRNANLWEISSEEFALVMRVNVQGVHSMIRHFMPGMIQARRGVIVNFSSGWGRSTSPQVAPYCASKYAIEGLSQALSQELPQGMASVALNPGIINTEMLQSCFGNDAADFPDADQWAKAAVPYILGLKPKHNGQSLTVPG